MYISMYLLLFCKNNKTKLSFSHQKWGVRYGKMYNLECDTLYSKWNVYNLIEIVENIYQIQLSVVFLWSYLKYRRHVTPISTTNFLFLWKNTTYSLIISVISITRLVLISHKYSILYDIFLKVDLKNYKTQKTMSEMSENVM